MRSFEDSLQRLGLPRIDLLLIHDLDISHHATDARVTAYLTELHNGGLSTGGTEAGEADQRHRCGHQ